MLEKIKLLLNLNDNDEYDDLLLTLINICKQEIITYCNLEEYNNELDFITLQMVIERYNRIGSEGTTKQVASGVTNEYNAFYDEKIIRLMNKFRKLKVV